MLDHYRVQITGLLPNNHGEFLEYLLPVNDYGGVAFDGFVRRGNPPVEIHLEGKYGYDVAAQDEAPAYLSDRVRDQFVKQARAQLRVVRLRGRGGRVEWHFSQGAVADAVRNAFILEGLDVDVYFTREIGEPTGGGITP